MAMLAVPSLEIMRGTVIGSMRPGPDSSIFLCDSIMTSMPPMPMPMIVADALGRVGQREGAAPRPRRATKPSPSPASRQAWTAAATRELGEVGHLPGFLLVHIEGWIEALHFGRDLRVRPGRVEVRDRAHAGAAFL